MIEQHIAPSRHKSRKRLLREAYHSKVLPAIARQCPILQPNSDEPFEEEVQIAAWKEKFRSLFHPGRSSEDLTDDEYAALIQQVEAHCAMEYGCEFRESARGAH